MNPDQTTPSPDPGTLWPPNQSEEVQSSTDAFVSGAEIVFSTGQNYSQAQPFSVVTSGSGFPPGHVVYAAQGFQLNPNQTEVIYHHAHSTFGRLSPAVDEYQTGSPGPLQAGPSSPLQHYQHIIHPQRGLATNLYPLPVIFERRQTGSPLIGQESHQSPLPVQLIGPDNEVLNQSPLSGNSEPQQQSHRAYSPGQSCLSSPQTIAASALSKLPLHSYTTSADGIVRLDVRVPGGGAQPSSASEAATSQQQIQRDVLRIAKNIEDCAERFNNEPDTTQSEHVPSFINDDGGDFPGGSDDLRTSALHGIHILAHSVDSRLLAQSHVTQDGGLVDHVGVTSHHGGVHLGDGVENSRVLLERDSLMVSDLVNFSSSHLHRMENERLETERVEIRERPDMGGRADLSGGLRKSSRLMNQSQLEKMPLLKEYEPVLYKAEHLWCDECMRSYVHACPEHKLTNIIDKVVLSRAWASLPGALQIFRLSDSTELGVFAKKPVPKRTQFGPFVAAGIEDKDCLPEQKFSLKIEQYKPPHKVTYLDATDESKCNWMMFVRPAQNYREQNLVAYQYQTDIYFTVTRNIEPREELKVWYAAHYAHHMGVGIHYPTEQDIDAISEKENKWPCFECSRRFKTSALLQAHLSDHEREETLRRQHELYQQNQRYQQEQLLKQQSELHEKLHQQHLMAASLRQPVNNNTNIINHHGNADSSLPSNNNNSNINGGCQQQQQQQGEEDDDLNDADFVVRDEELDSEEDAGKRNLTKPLKKREDLGPTNWKKKKSAMYLNRYRRLNRRQERNTLFKKRETEGENEWVCTHCDLTFDDSNLLNLHTLTHAAEDVGLSEIFCDGLATEPSVQGDVSMDEETQQEQRYSCPVCRQCFDYKRELIEHASCHAKVRNKATEWKNKKKYRCQRCWKGFLTEERLQKHMLIHGSEESKPISCQVCKRRFMNNSALACHIKIHNDNKFFQCLICDTGFAFLVDMKSHCLQHLMNGKFQCPKCDLAYKEYSHIHRHMKVMHPLTTHDCPHCDKKFSRPDKLRLHLLRHSNHREFMCETCGRQFKRKDKLKEHIDRIHNEEREAQESQKPTNPAPKFVPKVAPSDFTRFIYKCQLCMLGFKRRGMLVNHLANRHPEVSMEAVPELNLPILKTQRDYYCTFCDKVYKSSSKRKVHILKNHPGAELPQSGRKHQTVYEDEQLPGLNPTYSQTVGSVTTVPHQCHCCHKQYASKAKLLQHERKKHPGLTSVQKSKLVDPKTFRVKTLDVDGQHEQQQQQQHQDSNDLLTQAMSELTQTLVVGDFRLAANQFRPTEIQLTVNQQQGDTSPPTIDANQLQQLLQAAQFQQSSGQIQVHVPVSIPDSSGNMSQQQVVIPVTSGTLSNLQNGSVSYVPSSRTWTTTSSPSFQTTFR